MKTFVTVLGFGINILMLIMLIGLIASGGGM